MSAPVIPTRMRCQITYRTRLVHAYLPMFQGAVAEGAIASKAAGVQRLVVGGVVALHEHEGSLAARRDRRCAPLIALAAAVASQYFLTRTDVTQVNLSQNGRQKGRNGRRTPPPPPSQRCAAAACMRSHEHADSCN
jgi:hypothetical protein